MRDDQYTCDRHRKNPDSTVDQYEDDWFYDGMIG